MHYESSRACSARGPGCHYEMFFHMAFLSILYPKVFSSARPPAKFRRDAPTTAAARPTTTALARRGFPGPGIPTSRQFANSLFTNDIEAASHCLLACLPLAPSGISTRPGHGHGHEVPHSFHSRLLEQAASSRLICPIPHTKASSSKIPLKVSRRDMPTCHRAGSGFLACLRACVPARLRARRLLRCLTSRWHVTLARHSLAHARTKAPT